MMKMAKGAKVSVPSLIVIQESSHEYVSIEFFFRKIGKISLCYKIKKVFFYSGLKGTKKSKKLQILTIAT
jgi:hypothetical protein